MPGINIPANADIHDPMTTSEIDNHADAQAIWATLAKIEQEASTEDDEDREEEKKAEKEAGFKEGYADAINDVWQALRNAGFNFINEELDDGTPVVEMDEKTREAFEEIEGRAKECDHTGDNFDEDLPLMVEETVQTVLGQLEWTEE